MNARNRRQCLVWILLVALAFASAGQAQVYKCVVKGATTYQDAPCGTARSTLSEGTFSSRDPLTSATRQSTTSRSPEFAPGTVLQPPPIEGRAPMLAPVAPATPSVNAVAQTPYIARKPAPGSSRARDALMRAFAEERALHDQERAELDQLAAKWRSQAGDNTMEADMRAHTRRWDGRNEAARANVEAASKAVFAACTSGHSANRDCR